MIPVNTFIFKLKNQSPSFKLLYIASLMIFFWALFDGILAYLVPNLIIQNGFSKTAMGIILASSSIAGAIFDFVLSKFVKNTNYRRLFLAVYFLCLIFTSFLWLSHGVLLFVISMSVWGFYYDIQNFATFDFVSRNSKDNEHCYSFGIIGIFKVLGYFIAPLIAGVLVVDLVTFKPFVYSIIFLFLSFLFYLLLVKHSTKYHSYIPEPRHKKTSFFNELKLWRKIGIILMPVLIFNTMAYTFDAVFWSIGPLFSQNHIGFKDFGGLFMAVYGLPSLLTGWFIEPLAQKFGKKRTAYFSFLLCNILLTPLFFIKQPIPILFIIFISSFAGSIAWPAIKGAYVDYISESNSYEKEIEGLNDFSTNLGYIIGPVLAGFIADRIGIAPSFSLMGFINVVLILLLFVITPKNIHIVVHRDQ